MDLNLLDELERQHRMVEDLLSDLESAEEADAQRAILGEIERALAEHMEIEESQVYPRLQELDEELGEESEIEHSLVREALATLDRIAGQPGFGAGVAMLKAGIEHHVEEEEGTSFPMLREAEDEGGDGRASGGNQRSSGSTRTKGARRRRAAEEQAADGTSKAELYEKAKRLDIPGRARMSKDELAEAVRKAG